MVACEKNNKRRWVEGGGKVIVKRKILICFFTLFTVKYVFFKKIFVISVLWNKKIIFE